MNGKQLIPLLLLLTATVASITNTTSFWMQQLNISAADMHFQAYSGTIPPIQASSKSTGTAHKDSLKCSISFFLKWAQTSPPIPRFPSSSGFKEGQEVAPSSEHSPKWDPYASSMVSLNCSPTPGVYWVTCSSLISLSMSAFLAMETDRAWLR